MFLVFNEGMFKKNFPQMPVAGVQKFHTKNIGRKCIFGKWGISSKALFFTVNRMPYLRLFFRRYRYRQRHFRPDGYRHGFRL